VIDTAAVSMMNGMMRETLLTGTARKAEIPGFEAAGKTGTTQEFRDAWFVGYTGNLVAGVWLGNDDGTPTKKMSGSSLPVEVWSRFMKSALQGAPVATLPGSPGARVASAAGSRGIRQTGGPPADDPLTEFFGRIFGN
jgi:penicillin-binding protein 1A